MQVAKSGSQSLPVRRVTSDEYESGWPELPVTSTHTHMPTAKTDKQADPGQTINTHHVPSISGAGGVVVLDAPRMPAGRGGNGRLISPRGGKL